MTTVIRMKAANGDGLRLKKFEEVIFPYLDLFDPKVGVELVKNFNFQQGDIIQCSYPKAGLHWLGNMNWRLKTLQEEDRPKDSVIEFVGEEFYAEQEKPRIMFTHQKPDRLNPDRLVGKGKVVLMLRNPKDVAVSLYYHLKDSSVLKNTQTWDEFFQSYIEGDVPLGSYFAYLQAWEQFLKDIADGKSKVQLEVFYYEEFLLNPKENLARLNKFLEYNRDDEYMDRVLKETSLGSLRKHYQDNAEKLINEFCSYDDGRSLIFRKGQTGDWKNHFTVAQSEVMDGLLKDALQYGIIKFKYDM